MPEALRKIRRSEEGCKRRPFLASEWDSPIFIGMTKETRLRIIIVLLLAAGYIVVAVLRSGTAW